MQKWSEEEIALLKKHYSISETKQLLKFFPSRTRLSLQHKATKLGLRKEIKWWSKEELEILRDSYPNLSKKELLRILPKKDWTNIRHKAQSLGLFKNRQRFLQRNWKISIDIKLSDVDKGYLAGIIDGEGTIRIAKAHYVGNNIERFYYAPSISIANTNINLMYRIKEIVKIGSFIEKVRSKNTYKPKLVYNVCSLMGCKTLLNQLKDFLVIKKKQAEIVLNFIELKEQPNGIDPQIAEKMIKEIVKLNKRPSQFPCLNHA